MVYEDPDELGYTTHGVGPRGWMRDYDRDIAAFAGLSFTERSGIANAAKYAELGQTVLAEDYRNAVGYSEHIDPNDP